MKLLLDTGVMHPDDITAEDNSKNKHIQSAKYYAADTYPGKAR